MLSFDVASSYCALAVGLANPERIPKGWLLRRAAMVCSGVVCPAWVPSKRFPVDLLLHGHTGKHTHYSFDKSVRSHSNVSNSSKLKSSCIASKASGGQLLDPVVLSVWSSTCWITALQLAHRFPLAAPVPIQSRKPMSKLRFWMMLERVILALRGCAPVKDGLSSSMHRMPPAGVA